MLFALGRTVIEDAHRSTKQRLVIRLLTVGMAARLGLCLGPTEIHMDNCYKSLRQVHRILSRQLLLPGTSTRFAVGTERTMDALV